MESDKVDSDDDIIMTKSEHNPNLELYEDDANEYPNKTIENLIFCKHHRDFIMTGFDVTLYLKDYPVNLI